MGDGFVGIDNSSEFYAQHYLSAILAKDLRDVVAGWREASTSSGDPTPPQALANQHRGFFRLADRLERERVATMRVESHRELVAGIVQALGYQPSPHLRPLGAGLVPLAAEIRRPDGAPLMWWIPITAAHQDERPLLSQTLLPEQAQDLPELQEGDRDLGLVCDTAEEIATEAFNLDEPPRFLALVGLTELILLERGKWSEQRLLSFDLEEILSRRDPDTLNVTAALLHRSCLTPAEGTALVDTLDDESHKHAYEVSEDLKFALRECIELIGNAAMDYRRKTSKKEVFGKFAADRGLADELGRQCLRFAYRILFVLYIEARPELGYAPMKSEAFERGYSFERLRYLEQLELETPEALEGHYIHDCLTLLFRMIYEGCAPDIERGLFAGSEPEQGSVHGTFRLPALRSHLFDPERTALLNSIRLPNSVLCRVVELLSLSRGKDRKGKKRRRGRISYATLGVNQLGAVYEALLSYRAFFAQTDLYEVKPATRTRHDELKVAYFTTEDELDAYDEAERVYNDDGTLKTHPKGRFIYRLAGRERQKSASYYTPQVLTQSLVKTALADLLKDSSGKSRWSAQEILDVTVCEPAMGSAAFLNEAVDQLAEAYLTQRQLELEERIPNDRYGWEKQRVKMLLADNNVFGVDLNPLAVELAEVSLWLNTIHEGAFVPWFGMQLASGNSLIGARHQVYRASDLAKRESGPTPWLDTTPMAVPLGQDRPKGSVYHFLLPSRTALEPARDLDLSSGEPTQAQIDLLTQRRAAWGSRALSSAEIKTLVGLSDVVDRLWARHARSMDRVRARTTDPMPIYGWSPAESAPPTSTRQKDQSWEREITAKHNSPYRLLKLAMDYWCALWFWPAAQADLYPSHEESLEDLGLLLQPDTRPDGEADLEALLASRPRLGLVQQLADRQRFHHWELEFADVFTRRGGFDLVIGNPPWVRIEWKEHDVLGDFDTLLAVKKELSPELTALRRTAVLERELAREAYVSEREQTTSAQAFLRCPANYPLLSGISANLYKCFMAQALHLTRPEGLVGFVHQKGVYDDPRGGTLRRELVHRLRRRYHFVNQLKLFGSIQNERQYEVSVYAKQPRSEVSFLQICNLLHPRTIDECSLPPRGKCPGIKNAEGKWELGGHPERIVEVNRATLELFTRLFDSEEQDTPIDEVALPMIHSQGALEVLRRFADQPRRLSDLAGRYHHTMGFGETTAKRDGVIEATPSFPSQPEDAILVGSTIYVCTPLYKSAKIEVRHNRDFLSIDLEAIEESFLPRGPFRTSSPSQFQALIERWDGTPSTDRYRFANRRRISSVGERTLVPAILPPGPYHQTSLVALGFESNWEMLLFCAMCSSLPVDFFVKCTGKSDAREELLVQLPLPNPGFEAPLVARVLRLNCLTRPYAALWQESFEQAFSEPHAFSRTDPRLPAWDGLSATWTPESALRSPYARRQALVEIDVLAAMSMRLTLEELCSIYRVQFPVLAQNERGTFYDRNGRIAYTSNIGLPGTGLLSSTKKGDSVPSWKDVHDLPEGPVKYTFTDEALPGCPERTIEFQAPFEPCDRERDYELAWNYFTREIPSEPIAAGAQTTRSDA